MEMRKRHALLLVVSITALLVAVMAGAVAEAQQTPQPRQVPVNSTFSLNQARAFEEFPVYHAGTRVDGIPQVAVLRRTKGADFVSFIYGRCVVTSDTGCTPPAEVQTWPACKRSLALYKPGVIGSPIPEPTTVRGVPAAFFEKGTRLEIHTGTSLVVVFAESRDQLLRIANMLEGVNVPVAPFAPLPPPAVGAVEGKLAC
jgi:hypothetical protein